MPETVLSLVSTGDKGPALRSLHPKYRRKEMSWFQIEENVMKKIKQLGPSRIQYDLMLAYYIFKTPFSK